MENRSALIRPSSWNNSLIASLLVVMAGLAACWRALPAAIPEPATDTSAPVESIDLSIAPVNPSTLDLGSGYPDLFNAGLTIQLAVPDADYQKGGSVVTILGSGFTLNSKVSFGNNGPVGPMSVSADGSSMTVRVPANGIVDGSGLVQYRNPGLVSLSVSDSGRTASNVKAQFLYYIETISFADAQLIKSARTRYFQVSDITGDGFADIVMSNWVAVNNTNGTFNVIQSGCSYGQFALHDLDGDGFVDCVGRVYNDRKVNIGYGDGKGKFFTDGAFAFELKPNVIPASVYRLRPNGSSQADIIALDYNGDYYKITATGRVATSLPVYSLPQNPYLTTTRDPWIVDINSDGGDDLIFRKEESGHASVLGLIIGNFSPPGFLLFDPLSFNRRDWHFANGFFRRDSNRNYFAIKYDPLDVNIRRKITTYNASVIGAINEDFSYTLNPWVTACDVNGDLQRDIMYIVKKAYDSSFSFTFLLNVGTDKFVPTGKYFGILQANSSSNDVGSPVVIDINNDNRPDLVYSVGNTTAAFIYVRLGNGN